MHNWAVRGSSAAISATILDKHSANRQNLVCTRLHHSWRVVYTVRAARSSDPLHTVFIYRTI